MVILSAAMMRCRPSLSSHSKTFRKCLIFLYCFLSVFKLFSLAREMKNVLRFYHMQWRKLIFLSQRFAIDEDNALLVEQVVWTDVALESAPTARILHFQLDHQRLQWAKLLACCQIFVAHHDDDQPAWFAHSNKIVHRWGGQMTRNEPTAARYCHLTKDISLLNIRTKHYLTYQRRICSLVKIRCPHSPA